MVVEVSVAMEYPVLSLMVDAISDAVSPTSSSSEIIFLIIYYTLTMMQWFFKIYFWNGLKSSAVYVRFVMYLQNYQSHFICHYYEEYCSFTESKTSYSLSTLRQQVVKS